MGLIDFTFEKDSINLFVFLHYMQKKTCKFGFRVVDQPTKGKYLKEEALNQLYPELYAEVAHVANRSFNIALQIAQQLHAKDTMLSYVFVFIYKK